MSAVRPAIALLLGLLATVLAACGGGDESGAAGTTAADTAPVVTVTTPKETAQRQPASTGEPTFRITLRGENHAAEAGEAWSYVVTSRDQAGAPAYGTAKMRVFVGPELVDTLGWFPFTGRLSRTYVWQEPLRGKRDVVLQAEVEGDGGTRRLNWPVVVR
jgi:hypothetical protein